MEDKAASNRGVSSALISLAEAAMRGNIPPSMRAAELLSSIARLVANTGASCGRFSGWISTPHQCPPSLRSPNPCESAPRSNDPGHRSALRFARRYSAASARNLRSTCRPSRRNSGWPQKPSAPARGALTCTTGPQKARQTSKRISGGRSRVSTAKLPLGKAFATGCATELPKTIDPAWGKAASLPPDIVGFLSFSPARHQQDPAFRGYGA